MNLQSKLIRGRPTRAVERTDTAKGAVPPLTAISVCAKTSLALLAGCKSLPGKS